LVGNMAIEEGGPAVTPVLSHALKSPLMHGNIVLSPSPALLNTFSDGHSPEHSKSSRNLADLAASGVQQARDVRVEIGDVMYCRKTLSR